MRECLNFLMAGVTGDLCLLQAILQFFSKVRSKIYIVPAVQVNTGILKGHNLRLGAKDSISLSRITESKGCICLCVDNTVYLLKAKKKKKDMDHSSTDDEGTEFPEKRWRKEAAQTWTEERDLRKEPIRFEYNGKSDSASLFTKRGQKGANQDAMLVLENFTARSDTIFCGVFDGHGKDGHLVAKAVRDTLPLKLETCQKTLLSKYENRKQQVAAGAPSVLLEDPDLIITWKESLLNAYKLMDRDLLIDDHVDCVSSGSTAVTLVKQGNHLLIGSVGDSRAILGLKANKNTLLALQLTIDLTPNLPREAARIKRRKGRVFASRRDPRVKRVWLPNCDRPGLAMARAFGDYCLKGFGVISEPIITYRKLTAQDEFIVLATDGVWDVLSNEKVIEIVATSPVRSLAAKAVADAAVRQWKYRFSFRKADDIAVVCLFLDTLA